MKLPILLSLAFMLNATAQDTATVAPTQPELLPLPAFHESWSAENKEIITQFAERLSLLLKDFDNGLPPSPEDAAVWSRFVTALHHAVSKGEVAASFEGDGLARWAAMVDNAAAVRLFIEKGESTDTGIDCGIAGQHTVLAQEVIWSESLIHTHQTAAERVELLEWLKSKGWAPATQMQQLQFAISIVGLCENQDVSPLYEWFLALQPQLNEEESATFYRSLLVADGCTPIVQRMVEAGKIQLNEPLDFKLPLQIVCEKPLFDRVANLRTLQYLLEAGADPNLMMAYEDEASDNGEYDPDEYETDDLPRDDMEVFSTPIEIIFDRYRSELNEGNTKNEANLLAAIDLLLLHGAELDIEDDEYDDEEAESTAYAEVRKRLEMTPEQLRADFKRLTE